jgi:hypothetical protein
MRVPLADPPGMTPPRSRNLRGLRGAPPAAGPARYRLTQSRLPNRNLLDLRAALLAAPPAR